MGLTTEMFCFDKNIKTTCFLGNTCRTNILLNAVKKHIGMYCSYGEYRADIVSIKQLENILADVNKAIKVMPFFNRLRMWFGYHKHYHPWTEIVGYDYTNKKFLGVFHLFPHPDWNWRNLPYFKYVPRELVDKFKAIMPTDETIAFHHYDVDYIFQLFDTKAFIKKAIRLMKMDEGRYYFSLNW